MIGIAFGYYNYKFSQYKFIDFEKWSFYSNKALFTPKHEQYGVILYSSKMGNIDNLIEQIELDIPIIALDLYLDKRMQKEGVTYLTAGTNTMLNVIHRFAVREVPSFFIIKKHNDSNLYKQDSQVHTF
ncbi:MAG: hypothetical protein ACQESH_00190 [Campylobacterota bacterium]